LLGLPVDAREEGPWAQHLSHIVGDLKSLTLPRAKLNGKTRQGFTARKNFRSIAKVEKHQSAEQQSNRDHKSQISTGFLH
jgi:hypothetical protein